MDASDEKHMLACEYKDKDALTAAFHEGRTEQPFPRCQRALDLSNKPFPGRKNVTAPWPGNVLYGLTESLVHFEQAVDVVQMESNTLADIFLLAGRLPAAPQGRIRDTCRAYAHTVVEDEWPQMARGEASMTARQLAFELVQGLDGFEPTTESEKAVFPMLLEQMRELWDCRRERIGTARYGVPAIEWFVLVVGGAVTVLFAGLFRTQSVSLQRFLTALAALVIGLNLYLVALFGYPFSGELTVSSRPFQVDIAIFEGHYEDRPPDERERPGQ